MNVSAPFIVRPVATMLLAAGLLLAGAVAFFALPVAPLPAVDIPTIVVFAGRPGADADAMASAVTAPLERRLGEIAGVSEMTSTSTAGAASIVLQFSIDRDIDDAAHDVQAAIDAAAPDLPTDVPTRPFFHKFNPGEAPVLEIALTSPTLSPAQVYEAADDVLAQRLAQIPGVGRVQVNGAETPAVRVRFDPAAMAASGISGRDLAAAIAGANAIGPAGGVDGPLQAETIGLNGQLGRAAEYRGLVLKRQGSAVVTLSDVAEVVDATANARLAAWSGRRPAILVSVIKAQDANVIEVADGVMAVLPLLRAWLPADIDLAILADRTTTIRASVGETGATLLVTAALVLVVLALLMRRAVPALAAGVSVPLSVAGTFAAMWCAGFALDNFSLMALTISVGFVVDDAIVMTEAIVRHAERGQAPLAAALAGARQVGFTVLSISASLVAVFIPLLFMGGIVGRLFHEFATTLALAIMVSALVSLTLTPMLCGQFMRPHAPQARQGRASAAALAFYARTLGWALRRRRLMAAATIAAAALTLWLYAAIPKGLLPMQDTGLIEGATAADPSVSFRAMAARQREVVEVLLRDPAVATVGSQVGVADGFNTLNHGTLIIGLKPFAERRLSSEAVIARLSPALGALGGVQTMLNPAQDLRGGGRPGGANQFVLLDADTAELRLWTQRLEDALRGTAGITDVSADLDGAGPTAAVVIDRAAAARLGVTAAAIDDALADAFTQRQGAVIYASRNQYRVVLEVDPALQADPSTLSRIRVPASVAAGAWGRSAQVPLGSVARIEPGSAPLAVRHQGLFPAATVFFNVAPGVALGTALGQVEQAAAALHMPAGLRTEFAGNAKFLVESLRSQPVLIAAALLSVYIVLGVLYESLAQPLTILSSLPSASLGALLALEATGTDLSVVTIVGILLLMGIVMKNAIMLVDFALEQERRHGCAPDEAVRRACRERVRPIMMTTLCALLGALPLALASGTGAALRQPLGIAVVGGLVVSQAFTLYTTPVIYLMLQPRRKRQGPSGSLEPITNRGQLMR